jgi:CRISPR system Cascade subunit CasB
MKPETPPHPFVTYLQSLTEREDRAALAALRRGLGQPPGEVAEMHPYIIPRLPENIRSGSWQEATYYLIASLYALHPASAASGNLGRHFADTLDPNPDYNAAIERRFTALLTAHPADLPFYLRQAISYLKSKDRAINWHRLMRDVNAWHNPDWRPDIQKRWANQFWGRRGADDDQSTTADQPSP